MYRIRLLKEWNNGDDKYAAGEVLEIDDQKLVEDLCTKQIAERADKHTEPAKLEEKEDDSTKSLSRDEVQKMIGAEITRLRQGSTNDRPRIVVGADPVEEDPTCGYGKYGLGEFLLDVKAVGAGPYQSGSKRFANAQKTLVAQANKALGNKTVGSDELTTLEGAYGGFLIPPEFRAELLKKEMEPNIARQYGAMTIPITSNSMTIPAEHDEDRGAGTLFGGIQIYRPEERTQMTATRPKFQKIEITPKPLAGYAYVTDQMLFNAPAIAQILSDQFQRAWTQKENEEFIKGVGGGESTGVVNADCKIEVSAKAEQAAASIVMDNLTEMRSHCYDYNSAVWIASLSCYEHLMKLSINVGTGGAPLMLFNIAGAAPETILNRPLIYSEMCEAVGTAGDIILVSWPHYIIGENAFSRQDTSIHIRFDYNETAFRFVKYMIGQPWWRTYLTLHNDWTVSPVVTLAARA